MKQQEKKKNDRRIKGIKEKKAQGVAAPRPLAKGD
jgi:hypothetical protein